MIDKKQSRFLTLGGSEVERLCRKQKQFTTKMACNCAGKHCTCERQYIFEDSYTLYLEKIGVKASSWDQSGTVIKTLYADSRGNLKYKFDPYLLGEKITILENEILKEKIKVKDLEYSNTFKPNAVIKMTIENGNFNFGNLFEAPIRDVVNAELGSNFQEANKWRTDNDFTVINVDGYDPNFPIQLLEIKTTTREKFLKEGDKICFEYYHQLMRYIDVAYKLGKIKDKKIVLAIYLKSRETQHLTYQEAKTLLDKTFNKNNIIMYTINFDPIYYYIVQPKIERFRQVLEHFKATGQVLSQSEYNAIIFESANRNNLAERIK